MNYRVNNFKEEIILSLEESERIKEKSVRELNDVIFICFKIFILF